MKRAIGPEIGRRLTRCDRLIHARKVLLKRRETVSVDSFGRPRGRRTLDLAAHIAEVCEALEGDGRNTDAASGDDCERVRGGEPLERLAHWHGAYAERLGQTLDGDEPARRDVAVKNQAGQPVVDALLQSVRDQRVLPEYPT